MIASKEQMKQEAINRMALAQMGFSLMTKFAERDIVFNDQAGLPMNIQEIEDRENLLFYASFFENSSLGSTKTYLFVTNDTENWDSERELLSRHTPIAYVQNLSEPRYSEFGQIGLGYDENGIKRIW